MDDSRYLLQFYSESTIESGISGIFIGDEETDEHCDDGDDGGDGVDEIFEVFPIAKADAACASICCLGKS